MLRAAERGPTSMEPSTGVPRYRWIRDGYVRATQWRRTDMPGNLIYYALVLIAVALVAALLGFGGVASTAMGGAHLLIWVAVVVIIIGVVFAFIRRA